MRTAALQLTPRDLAILIMVQAYDGCTISHINTRYFSAESFGSACYRRVRLLVRHDYLQTTRLPSRGLGTGKAFVLLGDAGRAVLAEAYDLPRSELKRQRFPRSVLFAEHHAAICDVRVALELACERSGVFALVAWTTERELREAPLRVRDPHTTKQLSVVPDGRFTLRLATGIEQTFDLEVDMATLTTHQRLTSKLAASVLLAQQEHVPVLYVVPDAKRQDAITRITLEEAARRSLDPTLILVTTKDQIRAERLLSEPI